MPRLSPPLGSLYMSSAGASQLLGAPAFQLDATARTDTLAGDGEYQFYISGATVRLQVFDKAAGAWRAVQLT